MNVMHITKETFETEVLESDKPVLLDFWAAWCGPCKALAPILDEIAAERSDIKVCKVNIDEEQELASKYKIFSIPTLYVFKGGKIVEQTVGVLPKAKLLELL